MISLLSSSAPAQVGGNPRLTTDPPIVELALTLEFRPLMAPTVVDLADLHREFAPEYPTIQHAPRLPPTSSLQPGTTQLEMLTGVELPRLWFTSADLRDLVQFQSDRVSQNWRRIGPFSERLEYPGYASVRRRFAESVSRVERWSAQKGFGPLAVHLAELSYVNAIPVGLPGGPQRISDVLRFYKPVQSSPLTGFQVTFTEDTPDGVGTVQTFCTAVSTPEGTPALHVQHIGRITMTAGPVRNALAGLDVLHDAIHLVFERTVVPEVAQVTR